MVGVVQCIAAFLMRMPVVMLRQNALSEWNANLKLKQSMLDHRATWHHKLQHPKALLDRPLSIPPTIAIAV